MADPPMIDIAAALSHVENQCPTLDAESVAISDAVGRVLREEIIADHDLPPFDRSQMDGYALIAEDAAHVPVRLQIVGESAAGRGWHNTLKRGEAVRIMTGAPVPVGADAVQKLELATEGGDGAVEILESVAPGQHIVVKGSEISLGTVAVRSGRRISVNLVSTLAAFGYATVHTGQRPKVGIMSTGSEIVDIHERPGRDQIRNSNSVMLRALSTDTGAIATVLPIVGDEVDRLENALGQAAETVDILLITGGVSVGKYDYTKAALKKLGANIFFEKVSLKPGKPAVFAKLGSTLIFGLPGNPVSAAVTFSLFVRKAILTMQGANVTDLVRGKGILAAGVKAPAERDSCIPATLDSDDQGRQIVTPLKWGGSSDLVGFGPADSLIYVNKGARLQAGEVTTLFYLNRYE